MRLSRFGVLLLVVMSIFVTSSCNYYNRVISRKNLVDGSIAYKERKFGEAQELFRRAASRDPEGATLEGRTAQLFLARTLHSQFIGDRQNLALADAAIEEYKKMLAIDPNEQSSYKAIAGLYDTLMRTDDWNAWVRDRANNENILPQHRVEAFTSLAARQNTCASEISNSDAARKPIKRDGEDAYQYIRPAGDEEFNRFRQCVMAGSELIERAVALETDEIKNAQNIDIGGLSDGELREKHEVVKVFESARSYKTALLIQQTRLAEMENRTQDAERLRKEADASREAAVVLGTVNKNMDAAIEQRVAAQEANANAANAVEAEPAGQ
ncbi:MAG: hypothetical protein H0V76_01625 [Blastocatellia bacterium]|nr:hypothetical protein [Blastocatellia bacterium]